MAESAATAYRQIVNCNVPEPHIGSAALLPFPDELPTGLLIDGEWRSSSDKKTIEVIDPATEVPFAALAVATDKDVGHALAAARRGWDVWRQVDAWTRSAILRRVAALLHAWAPQLATVLTSEQGKPLAEARSEILAAADQFDWYADEARRCYGRTFEGHTRNQRILVRREPVGPVAAFSTWNFPALLPSRKIAPALAAGCSVVAVPAEESPFTAALILQACIEAGVPPGVVGMVTGNAAAISEQVIRSEVIRKISLTGSIPVGRTLLRAAAERIVPATMELGGHAPVLVFPDVDVETIAHQCVKAKFRNAGQVCASPSRFYVHQSIEQDFIDNFARATDDLVVGDGRDEHTDVGPLANERRLVAVEGLVADALQRGARLVRGGGRCQGFDRGYYFEPTVLARTTSTMQLMDEEPFGPIAPIASFASVEDALREANRTPFGLSAYVFTNDLRTAILVAEGLEAGMVGVNTLLIATAEAPFGGIKQSGYGREGGSEGLESYTTTKYVTLAL